MAKTNPYADLEAHQELMEKLSTAAENAELLNGDVDKALDNLKNHNDDVEAHPLIQRQIEDLKNAGAGTVDERIADHNASKLAHADIRAAIEEAKQDTVAAQAVITESIAAHNSATNTHSDIREQISTINAKVGDISVADLQAQVNDIDDTIDTDIQEKIIALQSVDAKHDSLIRANANSIADLANRLGITNKHTVTVANYVVAHQSEIDAVVLQAFCLNKEEVLGYNRFISGTDLVNFKSNLPIYVAAGSSVDFTLTGATGTDITLSVVPGVGSIHITSDMDPILQSATLTLHVDDDVSSGDILWFSCTVTDNTGGNTNVLSRVFAVMVAKPMTSSLVSIEGLPAGAEPDRTYNLLVSNLGDGGDGRYSYDLDPLDSGLVFSKTTGLTESESFTVTTPADGEPSIRGTTVTFKLIVNDAYGPATEIQYALPINLLPTTDNFYTNLPEKLVPGKVYTVKFSGIQSAQGNDATYSITANAGAVTFSKDTGILANENIKVTVASGITRGTPVSFVITATDENEVDTAVNLVRSVNYKPNLTGFVAAFQSVVKGGNSYNLSFIGGQDPERASEGDNAVSYKIIPNSVPFSFSKTEHISSAENVVVTIPKVAEVVTYSFGVKTVDDVGEESDETKYVTVTVEPIWVANAPNIISPQEDEVVSDEGFTMSWSGFSYYSDVN